MNLKGWSFSYNILKLLAWQKQIQTFSFQRIVKTICFWHFCSCHLPVLNNSDTISCWYFQFWHFQILILFMFPKYSSLITTSSLIIIPSWCYVRWFCGRCQTSAVHVQLFQCVYVSPSKMRTHQLEDKTWDQAENIS